MFSIIQELSGQAWYIGPDGCTQDILRAFQEENGADMERLLEEKVPESLRHLFTVVKLFPDTEAGCEAGMDYLLSLGPNVKFRMHSIGDMLGISLA